MPNTDRVIRATNTKVLLVTLSALCVLSFFVWPYLPSADAAKYFAFADRRSFFGIPNTFDVLSNIGFLIVGILGVFHIWQDRNQHSSTLFSCGILIGLALILTAFGSAYFHLNPNPQTLVWDRLPMTIGFSTVLSLIVADRVGEKIGGWLLALLIPFGLYTVIGLEQGILTLRPYLMLQFGSIIVIAAVVATMNPRKISNVLIWSAVGFYAVAKVFELADKSVFEITGVVSGHTLKHVSATVALYLIMSTFKVAK